MPKWWNMGFAWVSLITASAFNVHLVSKDPALTAEHDAAVAEYKEKRNLDWDWASSDLECQVFENCVHLEIQSTARCENQLKVFMYLTDEHDEWVDAADTVLKSPREDGSAIVEVGVNRDDFEFFMVGDVRCTQSVPTIEGLI